MENNVQINYSGVSCNNFAHIEHFSCLSVINCSPQTTDGLLTECSNKWNCWEKTGSGQRQMPGDSEFFISIPNNETIDFQLRFLDEGSTDRKNPNTGWGDWLHIQICDEAGNVVEDTQVGNMTDVADNYHNAWSGEFSYQVVRIDTSKFTTSCYSIRFFTDGGQEVCTHDIKRVTECDDLIPIESNYTVGGEDCLGNKYETPTAFNGTSAFTYSNKIWVKGVLRFQGGENETRVFADSVVSVEANDDYILHGAEKIAPFMMAHIKGAILTGQRLTISGIEYSYESAQFARESNSQMFKIDLEVYKPCSVEHACE